MQPHAHIAEIFAEDFATLFAATTQQLQSLQPQPQAMFPMFMPMQQQALAMQQNFGMMQQQTQQQEQQQHQQQPQEPKDLPGRAQDFTLSGYVCGHDRALHQHDAPQNE